MAEAGITFERISDDIGIGNLCDLAESIWMEYFPSIISIDQIEYMLKKYLSFESIKSQIKKGYNYFLVKRDRELIGFFAINCEVSAGVRRLFLSKLYLEQSVRGLHISTLMKNFIFEQAKEKNCSEVFLTVNKYNSHAIDVYYHWGFRKTDSVETDIGNGYVMDDYVMTATI